MLNKIKNDELVKGSFILFIMILAFNLLNYLFQISMARMLGPSDYGVLAVLMSLVYILGIPSEAIQLVVSKYTSRFNLKNSFGKMKELIYRSMKRGFLFSCLIFVLFLPVAFFLSIYLKIEFFLIAITGLFIFYVFFVPIMRGVIQGRKKFKELGWTMVVESLSKVILAVIFVLIGLKVYGAIIGFVIAGVIAFFVSVLFIKEVFASKKENESFAGVYSSGLNVSLVITSIVLMYSLDILFARKFFSPELAGKYAFVSMIGKTILFTSLAISKTLFPLSSENFESGKKTFSLFKKAILLVSLIAVAALLLFLFFPIFVIKIVSLGSLQYTDASEILFIIGLAFSMTAISNVIFTYNISINKMKKSSCFLLFFVLLQIVLLNIFNSSLLEFSLALLVVNFIMFLYALLTIEK